MDCMAALRVGAGAEAADVVAMAGVDLEEHVEVAGVAAMVATALGSQWPRTARPKRQCQ